MKIPTGEFGNVTYAPSSGAPGVPNAGAVGNAMQNLANAGIHAGNNLAQFGMQMMRNDADQAVADIRNYGEQIQNNPKDGQFTKTGINAQGTTEKYSGMLSKYSEQRLSKLDPLTRKMAMKYVNSYMTSFQRSGNIFERNQNQIVQRENYRATMKNTIDDMGRVGLDNAGAKLKLSTGVDQLIAQGRAMGLPDDAIQSDVHDLQRKGALNQLSNIAAQDPALLLQMMGEPSDNSGTTTSGRIASKGVRGVRNNNPGNLEYSAQGWDGELTPDGKFSRFDTPEHGIRALAKNMRTYQNKHDLNTVAQMISKFAPPEDHNDTPTYIKAVAGMMGVDPNQRIDTSDADTLTKLVNGIITVENGSNPYTDQQISDGVLAAMGAKQLPHVAKADSRPPDAGAATNGGVWGLQFLDPSDIAKIRNSAQAQLNRQQSKLRADMAEKLQDAKAAALNGQVYQEEIPVQDFINAWGPDKGLKVYQQYQGLNNLGVAIGTMKDKSPQEMQVLLEQSKPHPEDAAGDGYAQKAANYNALVQAAAHITEQRTKDPVNFLISSRHMDALKPEDLQSPDALKQALIRREDVAQEYSRKFSTPLRIFSNAEAKGLGDMLSKMDPKAEVDYLGKMYEATSGHPDIYNAALGQLFPYSPTAQFSGVLMQYDKLIAKEHWLTSDDKVNAKDVASLALAGAAARRTSKVTANGITNEVKGMPMPPDEGEQGMRTAFNSITGTAYAGHPDVATQMYDIAKDVYAGLMAQKGNYTGTLDSDAWAKAISLATGGISNFNNSTVPRPWGMSSDQFQDEAKTRLMDAIKARSNAKGDAEFFYNQNVNQFGLQNAGFGRYYVTQGNGFLLDRSGKPVMLDFTKPVDHSLDTPK
ncbi:hypothetical protein CDJ04_07120 [Salmonella enterica]|uniref:Uncharacterized protein n=2 Tax=Salmonella enterica TaxID=28901 RepID=A0A633DG45_SALER|nr:hypothetical protein [Salmonella enterica]EBW2601706.1 hypothetical protein [Salmonella enterica subsp. enterica serovar Poano]EBZ5136768.1 hypothetical protein [Salmonella enterica subsp. enterica serovar Antsalova]ECD6161632.1 hypothetical protein [Salmonella enterica subsp. enterica]ECU7994254.1 hypothetical protein [Salmonella enterica subsp. enterica serovar Toucra]EDX5411656.1 hypothetical protein [Salmonella enterica subsp. enterica serovar Ealing]EHI8598962.1 hypothetical protein [